MQQNEFSTRKVQSENSMDLYKRRNTSFSLAYVEMLIYAQNRKEWYIYLSVLQMYGLESFIAAIRRKSHGKEMVILSPYPGYLKFKTTIICTAPTQKHFILANAFAVLRDFESFISPPDTLCFVVLQKKKHEQGQASSFYVYCGM